MSATKQRSSIYAVPIWRRWLSPLILLGLIAFLLFFLIGSGNPYRYSYPHWYKLTSSLKAGVAHYGDVVDLLLDSRVGDTKGFSLKSDSLRALSVQFNTKFSMPKADPSNRDKTILPRLMLAQTQRDIIATNAQVPEMVVEWLEHAELLVATAIRLKNMQLELPRK